MILFRDAQGRSLITLELAFKQFGENVGTTLHQIWVLNIYDARYH